MMPQERFSALSSSFVAEPLLIRFPICTTHLQMATGASLAALISMYITGPLGMSDTIAAAGTPDLLPLSSSDWAQRVIPGHSENGALTWRNTSYGVLQGNGFLESSLVDMATFARTMLKGFGLLEYTTGTGSKEDNMEARELSAAFAEAFKMRAPSEARQHSAIGLGVQWYVSRGAAVRRARRAEMANISAFLLCHSRVSHACAGPDLVTFELLCLGIMEGWRH